MPGYEPANYVTERVWAPARDGTKIPVSIVYRKGFEKNGKAAMLQYGYGSYGASMDPNFSITNVSLLDRGVVYALAHIRGGQEMGRAWYDDGKLYNKINTFTDFIAAAEHLISSGHGKPGHIVAQGGSAGGLLMGAVNNMRPDLWAGVIGQVPFVDVNNTMSDTSLPLLQRIGAMFTDGRTWLTMLYFVLMLPLGVAYFCIATTLLSTSLALVFAPLADLFFDQPLGGWINDVNVGGAFWLWPAMVAVGGLLLFATLHLARGIGRLHGAVAKHLLVRL